MELEIWFSGVPLKVHATNNPWRSFSRTLPVFRHTLKTKLTNFQDICAYLHKQNYSADFNLSRKESADIVAYTSMLHQNLEPALSYLMYLENTNFVELTRPYMAKRLPFPSNYFVPGQLKDTVEQNFTAQFGDIEDLQMIETTVFKKAQQCLTLLAERLGSNEFFFGKAPTSFDALVFSYLAPLIKIPFPMSNHLKNHIAQSPNLTSFVNRILQNYFPTAKEVQKEENENDADFPNERRDIILFVLTATVLMTTYSIHKGIVQIKFNI